MKRNLFTAFAVGLCMTANLMAQVPNYVPTNGLVGWWPFNGNANDESGNGNNGTVNGATLTTDRFGIANKAYSFDGIQDFIQATSNITNIDTLSISTWVYLNSNDGGCYVHIGIDGNGGCNGIGVGSGGNTDWTFPGLELMSLQSCIGWSQSTYQVYSQNWFNMVFVKTLNTAKYYLNGNLLGTSALLNTISPSSSIFFGSTAASPFTLTLSGKLDDIGIWNRALTDQEITDLYNANVCYEYVTVTDTLVINTGITGYNPITFKNTLKIWPNPSNDHITIDAGNLATMNGYSIKIEDAQGQQVFQNAVNQQQFYVDITTWGGNGLYFVRIIDPQGNTIDIKKIVLQ
jgi:hypothetical protein